jgi:hypothetical protein
MEVIRSSETSSCIEIARRCIPEDDIVLNYHCESFKSYTLGNRLCSAELKLSGLIGTTIRIPRKGSRK